MFKKLGPRLRGGDDLLAPRASFLDQTLIGGAQVGVVAGEQIGASRQLLGLPVFALLQTNLSEVVPQPGIARLDAQRALERRRGIRQAAGGGVGARRFHQAGHGRGLGTRGWQALRRRRGQLLFLWSWRRRGLLPGFGGGGASPQEHG